jgi:4-hydroxy-3-methylbut-2-en-1-yl diphosphate reductase
VSGGGLLIAAPLRLEVFMISRGRPPGRIHRTGVGPRRARAAVPALLADPGEILLVLGFGGGLTQDSEVGEVVVADRVFGPDGTQVACADGRQLASAMESHGLIVRRGAVCSVARPAMGRARVRLHEGGAIAVDMESAWLAAAARGRPFAVVRVLSDTPARELTRPLLTVAGVARASRTLGLVAAALHEWVP